MSGQINPNDGIKHVKTSSVSSGAGVGAAVVRGAVVRGAEAIAAVQPGSSDVNPGTNVAGAIFQAALGHHPLANLLANT